MRKPLLETPTPEVKNALVNQAVSFFEAFHSAYERDNKSRGMEYARGIAIGLRWTLDLLYGERVSEAIEDAASKQANLTIPPSYGVGNDGEWFGMDSRTHTHIGKLHE